VDFHAELENQMKRCHLELTVGLFCLLPCLVRAHHSIAAEYDMHRRGTIQGVVSEVWFKNPHVRYYLSVTDDQGEETVWNAHPAVDPDGAPSGR